MSAKLADNRSEGATVGVDAPSPERKRVVIVGGGFAGLAAAHALRHADAEVFLIDRRNHHISRCCIRWRPRSSLPPKSPRRSGSSR